MQVSQDILTGFPDLGRQLANLDRQLESRKNENFKTFITQEQEIVES